MKILIVEDEEQVSELLQRRFQKHGTVADVANDGNKGLTMAKSGGYDVILLDVMLPGLDGWEFCQQLRAQGLDTFIIMLTARAMSQDKIRGLTAGADDYITKPFNFDELLLRIHNLTSRRAKERVEELKLDDLMMEIQTRKVKRGGQEMQLTNKEFQLLEYLLRRAGQVVSREDIINHVWDYEFDSFSNIVDVYIRYLRRKLDASFDKKLIHTVKGVGYMLSNKPHPGETNLSIESKIL